ncbi:efflux RND transporter permease subunit [Salipaludibacillus agaradhaerens]|uniref:efflux RND transporter permease subunit n=1 Tax=Salipaludibacillus agaradhaerens TaxID=76935 RepID=UPI002151AB6A|nr:efflux RND transporter permease subunit [Salipaludibacillus agaradhaerens]MCR6107404.1 efflux RND transporter permease subunit [Salipaludibacillus agaradhaerens]MCR6119433.1 efflux RND transporter permease subunit [Salipaludibacillus agaradhaerens]
MRHLTGFSIKRPVFTLVTMTLFLILGFVSLTNIPLKLIPDIDAPMAAVVTSYNDASPEEVVDRVTKPMEDSLSTISGLNNISSISMEGSSMTILEFSWTTSIDDVENDIISRMNQTALPSGAGEPQFLKFDPSQFPIIQLSLSAGTEDADLNSLVQELESDLLRIEGVATIDLLGDAIDEIAITLDQDELEAYGLDHTDVIQVLQTHNVTAPGGVVTDGDTDISTRVLFELGSVEDVENIVLTVDTESGDDITLADVANVEIAPEPIDVITQTNQEDAILVSVQQQADANTSQVSRDFRDGLDELLEEEQYSDIDSDILFDQGNYVDRAISSVGIALLGGGIIAMLVLFAFLRSFKTPLLIGIAIPFSVIVTFVLLYFSNFSLNIMTLGGLALGIGMLVDNSIVVIENIYRHSAMKKEPKQAAYEGTKEVATAITASTLTTISVFLPVVFISGIVGNLFREFALTVSFSLVASLFVALTIVPMLASRWLKAPAEAVEEKRRDSRFIGFFDSSTRWALKNRLIVFLITFVLLIAGVFGVSRVGTEFMPATDESFFQIEVENEAGTTLEVTYEDVQEIELILDDYAEIEHYTAITGSSGSGMQMGGGSTAHEAVIYVTLVPVADRDTSTMAFIDTIRRDVERAAPDADISMEVEGSLGTDPNTFTFDISDSNPERLEEVAHDLLEEFNEMNEFTDVTNSLEETIPELQLTIDDEAAREAGLTPAAIAEAVNEKTGGVFATQVVTAENDIYEVHVRYDDEYIDSSEALEELLIRNNEGEYIALSDLADFDEGTSPETINRANQEQAVQFSLTFGADYNLGEINELVVETIDDYEMPDETTISYTGDQQLLEDALSDLTLALILAIVFVYLVLAAQFESLRYPFVIMFTVPLVIIGVAIGLTVTLTPISVTAFIGLIVLVGIVVNNAIVLVDYINQRKEAGYRSYEAIIEGVKDRARPILMTALTTILGLVPLALGIGEGTEIQQPMAITVISGMISSTFLTLILIPVIYSLFDKDTRFINRKYMMPDGQRIPAYLLEDKYTDEQGRARQHYELPSNGSENLSEPQLSEFYKEADESPFNEYDLEVVDSEKLEDSQKGDSEVEEVETSDTHAPVKNEDNISEMSKEDLLHALEEIIEKNKNNRDK